MCNLRCTARLGRLHRLASERQTFVNISNVMHAQARVLLRAVIQIGVHVYTRHACQVICMPSHMALHAKPYGMMMMKALWVRAPFGAPQGVSGYSLFQPTRAVGNKCQASKQGTQTHRSRDIWGKVDLQACENEAGNAANVPLLAFYAKLP